ncbi:MAG: hypothetical protein HW421_2574 [Ignavibacteria bacterium]|nr:hypothetical protein [Ignavibacteria bacterium]
MENYEQTTLTYKQVQEMLCDYVFEKLEENEKVLFEASISLYPELQQEVENTRSVFGKIKSIHFDNIIDTHTRNLSVKIQNRLMKKRTTAFSPWNIIRITVPVFGLLIAAYLLVNKIATQEIQLKSNLSAVEELTKVKPVEVAKIMDNNISAEHAIQAVNTIRISIPNVRDINDLVKNDKEMVKAVDDEYADFILGCTDNPMDILPAFVSPNQILKDEIGNIDENDIKLILEELENEDFDV